MTAHRITPLLVVLAMLCAAGPAEAQFARRYAGISGGATYSNLTNYNVANSDWRWGGTAGLVIGTVTFDYSFVELAPSWTQQGGSDLRIDYVDIPLLIGGLIPVGDRDNVFRMYGGIALGLKVACNLDTICDAAKGSVWSLPVGVSFAKMIGSGRFIGVDGRYAIGLSDAIDVLRVTSRSWQFRALFGFRLGAR
ncbi:MAG: outer membrane beta-barrel protein [Gemmatimonadota bacterium]|nr:outer membrane beta-barrel protein [Gemmatimonadota bacterium]MDH4350799.1 outer membrane beta-barrel protein [Gemmatimonadota bacterium]MDH5197974.1 outer membrane beta-barrel protein [Gemmatimonadota bacterium]